MPQLTADKIMGFTITAYIRDEPFHAINCIDNQTDKNHEKVHITMQKNEPNRN